MTSDYPPTLQNITADRDWWLRDSGAHYRELGTWLREMAGQMSLAQSAAGTAGARSPLRTQSGAPRSSRAAGHRSLIVETPEWMLWVVVGLMALVILLP